MPRKLSAQEKSAALAAWIKSRTDPPSGPLAQTLNGLPAHITEWNAAVDYIHKLNREDV